MQERSAEYELNSGLGDDSDASKGVSLVDPFRRLWRDSRALIASLFVHSALLIGLASVPAIQQTTNRVMELIAAPEPKLFEEIRLIDKVVAAEEPAKEIGANSNPSEESSSSMARSTAPSVADFSQVVWSSPIVALPEPDLRIPNEIPISIGRVRSDISIKGATGVNATGIDGAVDRLTYEILRAMEQRPTLVVWLFDQSISLTRQRAEIRERFDRIYNELGVVVRNQGGNRTNDENRLLTAIIGFGQQAKLFTQRPVIQLEEIHQAIDAIQEDYSGIENVFTALQLGLNKFKSYSSGNVSTGSARNVLFVVVSDERGDDSHLLEPTIKACKKYTIPVYVLGVPAPFGRDIAYIKYVDSDTNFDQSPQFGEADQGPESILPERVRLGYKDDDRFAEPIIDSGFGPYALSRLTYETGGIFFTIHPNRRIGSAVHRGELSAFASDLKFFFDPEIMEKYRPDYSSEIEYKKLVTASKLRSSLVQAAQMTQAKLMKAPETRFVKRDEAFLASRLTEAQMPAARIVYDLEKLANVLKNGEADRDRELSPRWSAAFDLALGTTLAHYVRTTAYIEMLAKAKRGMNFENPKNNTWVLVPSNDISASIRLSKEAEKATDLLRHVIEKHKGTPWALLAQHEGSIPIGWKWVEDYTELDPPPRQRNVNVNPPPPPDDQRRMLPPPPPKRPLPKL